MKWNEMWFGFFRLFTSRLMTPKSIQKQSKKSDTQQKKKAIFYLTRLGDDENGFDMESGFNDHRIHSK